MESEAGEMLVVGTAMRNLPFVDAAADLRGQSTKMGITLEFDESKLALWEHQHTSYGLPLKLLVKQERM